MASLFHFLNKKGHNCKDASTLKSMIILENATATANNFSI